MTASHEYAGVLPETEFGNDYERRNQEAFGIAFEQYLRMYEDYPKYSYAREGKEYPKKYEKRDEELRQQTIDSMEQNYDLLQPLGHEYLDSPAGATVTIPVAINSEDFETLANTIRLVGESQQDLGQPVNVIIWANAFYKSNRKRGEVQALADENYARLQQMMGEISGNDLRIFTALRTQKGNVRMTDVRHDYMEATAMLCARQGNGFMHPVLWLDADTPSMRSNSLRAVRDEVEKGEVLFPHLKLHFEIDWTDELLSNTDSATRAVAVDEIHRRMAYRGKELKGYYEESGFATGIGTYLSTGGMNPIFRKMVMPAISETYCVTSRAETVTTCRSLSKGLEDRESIGWEIIPKGLIRGTEPTKLKGYIKGTSLSTSARRMYKRVNEGGANSLLEYGDTLANQMSGNKKVRDVNPTDMHLLYNSDFSHRPKITGKNDRIARNVIKRYFPFENL